MSRVDRYILRQLLVLFGFFALVLVALFWINRAVVLFERLIGDGQSALVFLEFTALALPRIILTILPIAAFAATVYVTNRLTNESELTVMQATGTSPFRLSRSIVVFGLIVGLMSSMLAHVLVPAARAQLSEREAEIAQNVTARLLTEGAFLSPAAGVTFYAREIGSDGILRDVFLADSRNPAQDMIYTAAEAFLLREGDTTTLVMLDGLAQRNAPEGNRLLTAKFEDFSFNISQLMRTETTRTAAIDFVSTRDMLRDPDGVRARTGASAGGFAEELHSRIARSLFCVVATLVGFATLLAGGFSRFGVWREIVIAFGLLLLLDGLIGAASGPVIAQAALWPMFYLPSIAGLALSLTLLWWTAHPGWWRRRRPA